MTEEEASSPPHVHFWTRRLGAETQWDPDADPDRHPSAYGHAFLELYWRMRAEDRPVSIGPVIASQASTVLSSLEETADWGGRIQPRMAARLALALLRLKHMPAVALVRVDAMLTVAAAGYTTLELMPTRAAISRRRQVWLPLLPQRGMIPRAGDRRAMMRTVAIKAYAQNVPDWVDDEFVRRVGELGYALRIDDEDSGLWRDFGEVDVVLCTHDSATVRDARRKPATKLINAWRAGVIPICASHIGYTELAVPDETAVFAGTDDAEGFLDALQRLKTEPALGRRVRDASPGSQFSPEVIVDRYWQALTTARRANRTVVGAALCRALVEESRLRLRRRLRARTAGDVQTS